MRDVADLSPRNAKQRAKRAARVSRERVARDMQQMIDTGQLKAVAEWDFEELSRGKPRDRNGKFRGRAPSWIDETVRDEIKRRLKRATAQKLGEHAGEAVAVLVRIMNSPEEDGRTRADAAKFIIDHIVGKATNKVEIEGNLQLRDFLADALVLEDGREAHPIIDGHLAEDREEAERDFEEAQVYEDFSQPSTRPRRK